MRRLAKKIVRRRISAPGCDDAPHVTVERGEPKPVTLIYPYYENPKMLAYQVGIWNVFAQRMNAARGAGAPQVSVVVVDDGSPDNPAETVLRSLYISFPFQLYRIGVDVRWNWLAARNLAFDRAPEGWCLVTDMDHIVPPDVMHAVVCGAHDPGIIYRFRRRDHDGTPVNPHPNSWLMTREMFWRIGGYDEALSGHYGTDGEYRRRCAATAPIRILTDTLIRHEFVLDASTTRYTRKQPEDAAVQRMVAARGPDWKPKVLSFPWTRVL